MKQKKFGGPGREDGRQVGGEKCEGKERKKSVNIVR